MDIIRFTEAHKLSYKSALMEIKYGKRIPIGCGIYFHRYTALEGVQHLNIMPYRT